MGAGQCEAFACRRAHRDRLEARPGFLERLYRRELLGGRDRVAAEYVAPHPDSEAHARAFRSADREFRVAPAGGEAEFATAHVTRVGEDFLEAVGALLLRGRTITAEDRLLASPVAVISAPLALRLFPGAEAIGRKIMAMLQETASSSSP